MKKISIDENNYIKVLPNGDFEIHCYACGPTGSNVYYFKNNNGGLLEWTQRRSYGGMGKKYNIYILMKNNYGWVKNNPLPSNENTLRL